MPKIITHDGVAHLDEVWAIASLFLANPALKSAEIIRTRDIPEEAFEDKTTIIVDVGRKYEPQNLNFDHHQIDAPERSPAEPLAAAGLIWQAFGKRICEKTLKEENIQVQEISKISREVEEDLITTIDFLDCEGANYDACRNPRKLAQVAGMARMISASIQSDEDFLNAVNLVEKLIRETVLECGRKERLNQELKTNPPKKDYLELSEPGHYWKNPVAAFPNVKFVVFEQPKNNEWAAQSTQHPDSLCPLPWRGKIETDLATESGVKGAKFCHTSGFYITADSKEAILKMINNSIEYGKLQKTA